MRSAGARLAVAAAFAAAFLWQVYGALSNLLAWVGLAALARQQLTAFAWSILLLGMVIPIACFIAAAVFGRRRRAPGLALILLAALCASQALGVSQYAFFLEGIGAL